MMELFHDRAASPMLIGQQRDAFDDPDWIFELKMDGFRCLAYINDGMVDLRNKRNMQMLPRFPELADLSQNAKNDCILDGEVVVMVSGVPDFYRLQKRTLLTDLFKISLEASRYPASFVAFDCLYINGRELLQRPLLERKTMLSDIVIENGNFAVSRYIQGQGKALYEAADDHKLEGVVAKRKESLYFMGKRTKDWIKFKRMADEDFIVAGYIPKGSRIFSLVLAKYRDGKMIYQGHVTAGVMKETITVLEPSGAKPFRETPPGNEQVIWVVPDHVCIVEYMANERGVLRQPVFKGFREDARPEEIQ